jgi:hypothetical protein
MLAATFRVTAKPSHTSQFESGPVVKRNGPVQPRLLAKSQAVSEYAVNTPGPIKSDNSEANFCAVSPNHFPA